jgi:hypothetical protein
MGSSTITKDKRTALHTMFPWTIFIMHARIEYRMKIITKKTEYTLSEA